MSEENVALARQAYEAWNRQDLEWISERLTEDFELRPIRGFFDLDEVYRGKHGWRRFSDTWREAWQDITVRLERVEDLGDRLLALLTFDGTGRGSGVAVSMNLGHVVTFRAGLVAELRVYETWSEALRAAGLPE